MINSTCFAEFKQIKSIKCSLLEDGRALLLLGISGAPQPLAIKTSSLAVAENMADLIDGYCRLQNESQESLIVYPGKENDKRISLPRIPTHRYLKMSEMEFSCFPAEMERHTHRDQLYQYLLLQLEEYN
ncbi:unnamed protein product [Ranitomeya imitator]|uniref:FAK1-like FERM domain-containing protein n=1 Tax=Ranitomeya imitator TaxID=111125 RepID=A0ABN9LR34_9NEOB|nr:unnamed protein product [Ranitomeya imitator]